LYLRFMCISLFGYAVWEDAASEFLGGMPGVYTCLILESCQSFCLGDLKLKKKKEVEILLYLM
jgi:hypothetical protein